MKKHKESLWKRVKNYLGSTADQRKLHTAEVAFDELMEKLQEDSATLNELEHYLRKEFNVLEGDLKKISKEVEKVVRTK
jgi:hypothetical protein